MAGDGNVTSSYIITLTEIDMSDIDKILNTYQQNADRISTRDDEQEYVVLGYKDMPVPVPFSHLSEAKDRCSALERLLRKNVPTDTILAFIERAKTDGRWA